MMTDEKRFTRPGDVCVFSNCPALSLCHCSLTFLFMAVRNRTLSELQPIPIKVGSVLHSEMSLLSTAARSGYQRYCTLSVSSICWHFGDQQSVTNKCVMVKVTEITFYHFYHVPCQHTQFSCFSKNVCITLLPHDSLFASEHIFLKKDSNQSHFLYIITPHTVDSRHFIF